MNTTFKRNSTISLKKYTNWRPQDDHSCRTCVRVAELCKEALGNIKNTSKNYQRGRPSLSKLSKSCILLYMHSKRIERAGQKLSKML